MMINPARAGTAVPACWERRGGVTIATHKGMVYLKYLLTEIKKTRLVGVQHRTNVTDSQARLHTERVFNTVTVGWSLILDAHSCRMSCLQPNVS